VAIPVPGGGVDVTYTGCLTGKVSVARLTYLVLTTLSDPCNAMRIVPAAGDATVIEYDCTHTPRATYGKWSPRFPSIAKSWRANWVNIIPFFSYPPEIRKVIYTTNAIESMPSSLRKLTRQRGAFPNPESVRKVMYLALQRISKNWKRPVLDWVAALNHFSVVFEGRI
jgi:hypothetical protein